MIPFALPLDRERDPGAWQGGVRRRPTWERTTGLLDRAGFHALLRAAQLPRAELHHMGADDELLARTGDWCEESAAVMLLGRIVWDATVGDGGARYADGVAIRRRIEKLGHDVVVEHFNA